VSTGFGWTWMKRLVVSLLFQFVLCQMTSQSPLMLPLLSFQQPTTSLVLIKDQRGMGRSTPTFTIPECAVQMQGDESNVLYTINYNDEHSIRAAAQLYKKVHLQCWNHPSFQLEAGNVTYHFLEHSGK
jgi:hypothetical protein